MKQGRNRNTHTWNSRSWTCLLVPLVLYRFHSTLMKRPLTRSIKNCKFLIKTMSNKCKVGTSSICSTCSWLNYKMSFKRIFSRDSNEPLTHLVSMKLSKINHRTTCKDNDDHHSYPPQKRLTSTWVCHLSSLRAQLVFLNQKDNPSATATYNFIKEIVVLKFHMERKASTISINILVTIILLWFRLKSWKWQRMNLHSFLILHNQLFPLIYARTKMI